MKGKKRVIIQNNRVHYEFVIKRNITIIQGDSASGKTTLVNMIRQAENLGESSGINVSCEVPCRVLEGVNWKIILENSRESIFFIDEENYFIKHLLLYILDCTPTIIRLIIILCIFKATHFPESTAYNQI